MPHLPGLDGLRGLAVIGAILFHADFSWARGGYLGVSTFFVLSGFLITSLLIREWDNNGTVRLGRFWARRFRRLLPAAMLTLALVALIWGQIGSAPQIANLRWDLLAALTYVANWRFYLDGTSYAELFSAASPLQHFWSLAIEEQFYLIFPPVVIALLNSGGRRLMVAVLGAAIALSIALGLWLGANIDRLYYGTDTRAAELLAGALLALWWSRPPGHGADPETIPNTGATRLHPADVAGLVALGTMFWAWWAIPNTSRLLSFGGLPLHAALTALIIAAATRPGLVARLLSCPPLRWVGLISYGLYLYHWPVFLILDEQRLGWSPIPLFILQMTVTTVIATASYRWLEMPIRRGHLLANDRAALGAALACAFVISLCAVLVTMDPPRSAVPYAEVRMEDFAAAMESDPEEVTTGDGTGPIAGSVLILGDSGMADASPALSAVFVKAGATSVLQKAYPGTGLSNPQLKWRASYESMIRRHQPALVIMMLGGWDLQFLQEKGTAAYARLVNEAARILTAQGARLLWLSMLPGGKNADQSINRIFRRLPERFPDSVAFADIEASLRAPQGAASPIVYEGVEDWPRAYVDTDGATVILRKYDFWHLCPTGAERLARAINRAAAGLGWAAEATPGWEQGEWRADARYTDPDYGCVDK